MQGESLKVLKAVEAVVGHLRKFLVDQSILPLFEKSYNTPASQECQVETWAEKSLLHSTSQTGMGADYPLAVKRDPLFHDRETQFESNIHSFGISLYGQDPGLSGMRSSGLGRAGGPFVTQEPLCGSISSQLRNSLQGLNIASELEQAVQLATNDNLDLGCALIEQAATENIRLWWHF